MAENMTEVYLKLIQMAIITFILILLYYRYKQRGIKALFWLIAIFAFADLQGVVELLIYVYKVNILQMENTRLFRFNEFHTIPYSIALLGLFLMTEYMQGIRPSSWKFGTVMALWGSYFSLLWYDMFNGFDWSFTVESLTLETPATMHPFNTAFNLFQFVLITFVSHTFWRAYRTSHSKLNKKVAFWMFVSVVVFTVVAFEELTESIVQIFVDPNYEGFIGYRAIYYGITFFILAFVYVKYPYYVFNVPTYVYRIILATEVGTFIYGAEIDNPFKGEGDQDVSNELLAGALSAMAKFMEESTGSRGTISLVELDDRSLLVRREEKLVGLLIAETPTRMLRSALGQFVREFQMEFKDSISTYYDSDSFKGSEYVIARCFPFVEANDIIRLRLKN